MFHDDQHGTAIVCLSGVINALKVVKKLDQKKTLKFILNGAGAAGKSICDLLLHFGFENIIVLDRKGSIYKGREDFSNNKYKKAIAERTNKNKVIGNLEVCIKKADVFIGVSAPNVLKGPCVSTMNKDSIIFALANPVPEIMPDIALKNGARIVATGRSDFPN